VPACSRNVNLTVPLEPFIRSGKPVFNAEYLPLYVNDAAERQRLCADS